MHEEFSDLVRGIDNQHRQLYADIMSELIYFKDERKDTLLASENEDELYEQAREMVTESGRASTSFIQRYLGVGYSRAAKLLDMLEENGVVGPANGAKPREILVMEEEM
jgi:S-DNA-T family DNA segregation ATPase FtsK/SpoIIIE